jgi:tRNA (cmo5U34)-methyltransferase
MSHSPGSHQFHFDPSTYLELTRAQVPAYDRLQEAVADAAAAPDATDAAIATGAVSATRVLDLGTGTGETLAHVLDRHPGAVGVGIDKSPGMLEVARARLEGRHAELRVAELSDPLPAGPFDLVVSALAVHHLDGPDKADLFARVFGALRRGGRFVLGDVVIPAVPADAVTPVTSEHDHPSMLADLLAWLSGAGFGAAPTWSERDLVVLRADRPA